MYKEMIISIIIVILIFCVNSITQKYTKESIEKIQEILDEINLELEKTSSVDVIREKFDKVDEEWKKRNNKLSYYLEHTELEKIETELKALNANILANDYEVGRENLQRCYFLLEHIKEKEVVKLSNIF